MVPAWRSVSSACAVLCFATLAAAPAYAAAPVDALLSGVPKGGQVAFVAIDTVTGEILAAHDAERALPLASTAKVLVAAAALDALGPTYQFRTRLVALGATTSAPSGGSSAPGLGVIGGGDPCLDEHFTSGDPDLVFRTWAGQLRQAGIARIDGDLVIDGSLFSGPIRPASYPQDGNNPISWFSAPASAFAFNDNCISVRAIPAKPGLPCRIELRPQSPDIAVVNRTQSVAAGGDRTFIVTRDRTADTITVSGSYAAATSVYDLAIHADPERKHGEHLAHILRTEGIALAGSVRLGRVDPAAGALLIDHRNDLLPALRIMGQRSQNLYAEQMLRLIAVAAGQPGSIDAGCAAVRAALATRLGAQATLLDALELLDGSGLSYGNRGSPLLLATLLRTLATGAHRDRFADTLKERDYGSVRGRVKTGTLAIACCLTGYLDAPGRSRVAFAILIHRGSASTWAWAPPLRDKLYAALAALAETTASPAP